MARIRTIKPEFFEHYDLWKAETEEGLPLRVAFAGLWTICDREGRFRWEPPRLKIKTLPYDDVDFSRVLHALTTRGFVVRYRVNDCEYAYIPSFTRHQVINNKERASELPNPNDCEGLTRASRVDDACPTALNPDQAEQGTRNKEQGKEQGTRKDGDATASPVDSTALVKPGYSDEFETFWRHYPEKAGKKPASKAFTKARKSISLEGLLQALERYIEVCHAKRRPYCHAATWLNQERWNDEETPLDRRPGQNMRGATIVTDGDWNDDTQTIDHEDHHNLVGSSADRNGGAGPLIHGGNQGDPW